MSSFKNWLKIAWIKISGWLLAQIAIMWEEYLKQKLKEDVEGIVHVIAEQVKEYRETPEYIEKKDAVYDKIFEGLKLPLLLKPFKGIIKIILKDNIDKKVNELLEKIVV